METKQFELPERIKTWLNKRGISDEVISDVNLSWNGREIVIPVFNENGDLLFNKYRRDPENDDGPKYRYDQGAGVQIYNIQILKDTPSVIICEGELDALVLMSKGFNAVTSTGGSGSFQKDWVPLFKDKEVFICFDRDVAGYKGMMKVQMFLPNAHMIHLPSDTEGNDITDYFQTHTKEDFLKIKARQYVIPMEPTGHSTDKKDLQKTVKVFKDAQSQIMSELRRCNQDLTCNITQVKIIQEYINSRTQTYIKMLKNVGKKFDGSGIAAAKEYPIDSMIHFNYQGFAKCLWHNDRTPSLRYNKPSSKYPNTVKCFSCGFYGDAIDVFRKVHGDIDLPTAVKRMTGKE